MSDWIADMPSRNAECQSRKLGKLDVADLKDPVPESNSGAKFIAPESRCMLRSQKRRKRHHKETIPAAVVLVWRTFSTLIARMVPL